MELEKVGEVLLKPIWIDQVPKWASAESAAAQDISLANRLETEPAQGWPKSRPKQNEEFLERAKLFSA